MKFSLQYEQLCHHDWFKPTQMSLHQNSDCFLKACGDPQSGQGVLLVRKQMGNTTDQRTKCICWNKGCNFCFTYLYPSAWWHHVIHHRLTATIIQEAPLSFSSACYSNGNAKVHCTGKTGMGIKRKEIFSLRRETHCIGINYSLLSFLQRRTRILYDWPKLIFYFHYFPQQCSSFSSSYLPLTSDSNSSYVIFGK